MMGFLLRLFRAHHQPEVQIVKPDDSHLNRKVKEAKWQNARAVNDFIEAAQKQENDANVARQVISDVLARTKLPRAPNHARNEK